MKKASKKTKAIIICIIVAVIVALLGGGGALWFAERNAGPKDDMNAITEHLAQYGSDPDEIREAENLAVCSHIDELKKLGPWHEFAEKVNKGKPAWVDVVTFTDEGDPIFNYIYYDGAEFLFVEDTTRDHFGTPLITKEKYTMLFEFNEVSETGYEIYNAVLSNIELNSIEHQKQIFWDVYAQWEAGEYDPETAEYQLFPRTVIR